MPAPISSLLPSGITPSSANAGKNGKALGKNEFLKLLVTQLKNQDPMNPANASDFAAQLAQFSSVEQLMDINTGLAGLSAASAKNLLSQQMGLATGLVGRSVLAEGTSMSVTANGTAQVTVELPAAASKVTVRLVDSTGHTLASREFGSRSSGRQTLTWQPGAEVGPGNYQWVVDTIGQDGQPIQARQLMAGSVDGIAFEGGAVKLKIRGTTVAMEDVIEVGTTDTPAA